MGKNRIVALSWQDEGATAFFPVVDESATWRVFNVEGASYVIPGAAGYGTERRNDLFLFPADVELTEADIRGLFPLDSSIGSSVSYDRFTDNASVPRIEVPGRLPVVSVSAEVTGHDYGTYLVALVLLQGSVFPFDNLWGELALPFDILRLTRRTAGPYAVNTYLSDFPFGRTAVLTVPGESVRTLSLWCEILDSSTSDVLVFDNALRASVEGVAVTVSLRLPYRPEVPIGSTAEFELAGVPSGTVWRVASTEPVERRRQMDIVITAEVPVRRAAVSVPGIPESTGDAPAAPPALPLPAIPADVSQGVFWSSKKAYPFEGSDFVPLGVRVELMADGITQGIAAGRAYVAVALDSRFTVVDWGYALRSQPNLFTRGYDVALGGRTFQVWRALTWEPAQVPYITVRLLDAGVAPRAFPVRMNPNPRMYWNVKYPVTMFNRTEANYYGSVEDARAGRTGLRPGRTDFRESDFAAHVQPVVAGQGRYRIRFPNIDPNSDTTTGGRRYSNPDYSSLMALAVDWRFTIVSAWQGTSDAANDIVHNNPVGGVNTFGELEAVSILARAEFGFPLDATAVRIHQWNAPWLVIGHIWSFDVEGPGITPYVPPDPPAVAFQDVLVLQGREELWRVVPGALATALATPTRSGTFVDGSASFGVGGTLPYANNPPPTGGMDGKDGTFLAFAFDAGYVLDDIVPSGGTVDAQYPYDDHPTERFRYYREENVEVGGVTYQVWVGSSQSSTPFIYAQEITISVEGGGALPDSGTWLYRYASDASTWPSVTDTLAEAVAYFGGTRDIPEDNTVGVTGFIPSAGGRTWLCFPRARSLVSIRSVRDPSIELVGTWRNVLDSSPEFAALISPALQAEYSVGVIRGDIGFFDSQQQHALTFTFA